MIGDELDRQGLQAYNDEIRREQNARDQAVRAAGMNELSDEDRLGRAALNRSIAENKAAAAERAAAKVKAEKERVAETARLADIEALRLRGEIRRAYAGTDSDFAKAYSALLEAYREQETFRNISQRRADARQQMRRWG